MSFKISLRRSPNPGAFTAATWRFPLSLLITSVASDSPSTSSATMSKGFCARMLASKTGTRSAISVIFFSLNER